MEYNTLLSLEKSSDTISTILPALSNILLLILSAEGDFDSLGY